MAGGTDVSHLGVAHGADHEVTVDGTAALGADAIMGELVLTECNIEVLLLAVDEVGTRTQDNVGEDAHDGDNGNETPEPTGIGTTSGCVSDDIDDGKDVYGDDTDHHKGQYHSNFGRDKLPEELAHLGGSFKFCVCGAFSFV
jgi:hypothetical protein